ncbi:FAD-binding protein, partial [Mycobacterium sp.]
MGIEFNPLQRKTLTAIVDTFVAAVPREDDPTGFYAAKGSDIGADVAAEQYLVTRLPEEQLTGLLQLIDTAGLVGLKNQPQAVREAIIANLAAISPESARAVAALYQLSVIFAYSLPGPEGGNPLWAGMGYPGMVQAPPQTPKTLDVITPSGETTLEADVVVVGSGSGGGVAAAVLAQAGKRVIILEAGGYFNESDFVQLEPLAYQNLFLRGGFFPS